MAEAFHCGCGKPFTIPDEIAVVHHGSTSHIEIDGVHFPYGTRMRKHGSDGPLVVVTFEVLAETFREWEMAL